MSLFEYAPDSVSPYKTRARTMRFDIGTPIALALLLGLASACRSDPEDGSLRPTFREAATANRCTPADSTFPGTVWGVAAEGDSIPRGAVQIWLSPDETCGVLSDSVGQYTLYGIPDGEHVLAFQLIGYRRDSLRIRIEGDTVYLPLRLRQIDIPLDDLIIRGTSTPAPASPDSADGPGG